MSDGEIEGKREGERKSVIRKHTDLDVYQRSVAANITEAWRKRKYPAAFIAKLSVAEAEAAETQTWLQFAVECGYLDKETATPLYLEYDRMLGMLVTMATNPTKWSL